METRQEWGVVPRERIATTDGPTTAVAATHLSRKVEIAVVRGDVCIARPHGRLNSISESTRIRPREAHGKSPNRIATPAAGAGARYPIFATVHGDGVGVEVASIVLVGSCGGVHASIICDAGERPGEDSGGGEHCAGQGRCPHHSKGAAINTSRDHADAVRHAELVRCLAKQRVLAGDGKGKRRGPRSTRGGHGDGLRADEPCGVLVHENFLRRKVVCDGKCAVTHAGNRQVTQSKRHPLRGRAQHEGRGAGQHKGGGGKLAHDMVLVSKRPRI